MPRVDSDGDSATLGEGVDHLIDRANAARKGAPGPKLRLLPELVTLDKIRDDAVRRKIDEKRILIGINEKELAPVAIDVNAEPHLLIYGDGQSGKSALLRNYVKEVMRTRTPKEAQIVIVDYRRSLLGEVPDEYLLNYLTSATRATPTLKDIAAYLESRIPGPDVTPDQLRNRSWWTGAEVFVVVDDYDLGRDRPVLAGAGSPAADGAGPRHGPAPRRGPPRRWRVACGVRTGPAVDARLGDARRAAVGTARRGCPHRQPASAALRSRSGPRRHP
ncbi:FtsK/SpoIIIE domain-containing protein [Nocardioides sp. B-3]|uniref:FtsK/SpoIIIE domain-containing protein n=1 Tax=Nocardioides sp. B-3 TaxID=2895565 RepID=UPI002152BA9C|nr:FtsK/SpoIIIE domain-containing protein [Nocardioides sp. B-3]UUZ60916.1 hypothetical protein LP418_09475 [Nocardioides sp. B-3]